MTRMDAAKQRSQGAELAAKKYDLAKYTLQAYLDCAVGQASKKQQAVNINDNEALMVSVQAKYEAGAATQAEVSGLELQIRQQKFDLETAKDKSQVACEKLNRILGQTETSETAAYELPDDFETGFINEIGPSTSDESRALGTIGLATASESLAWWGQVPDFTLGVQKNHYMLLSGSPSGQANTFTYTVSVTLPLLFPFKRRLKQDAREARR